MIHSFIIKTDVKTIKRFLDIKTNVQMLNIKEFTGVPSAFDQTLLIIKE